MKNTIPLFIIISFFMFSCRNEDKSSMEPEVPRKTLRTSDKSEEAVRAVIEDTIEVYSPRPGESISSPQKISGRARGYWFFEGSFAVRLMDENNREIAVAVAEAQDPWMTENWVEFKSTLSFDNPASERGGLVFEKANPSGLEKHERQLRIPVVFEE